MGNQCITLLLDHTQKKAFPLKITECIGMQLFCIDEKRIAIKKMNSPGRKYFTCITLYSAYICRRFGFPAFAAGIKRETRCESGAIPVAVNP